MQARSARNARAATLALGLLGTALLSLAPTCGPRARVLIQGLSSPMYVTAPTGDPRLFVVERAGRIRIFANGSLLAAPFLDITARISTAGEGGLLGLAFSPQYASNGQFYVFYANLAGDTVLSRFVRSGADPNLADAASERVLLTLDPSAGNHKGGTIAFSPVDGYLYVAPGDGGDYSTARDPSSLLGKMLRIDVSGGPTAGYTIPPSNPFVGPDGIRDEIWSFGFRNPFRWSFDRANGDLWIGDVGQDVIEEVDYEPAGAGGGLDYGWPTHEGSSCFLPNAAYPCDDPAQPTRYVFPVAEYTHADGCAITGGVRSRDTGAFLAGYYLFGDFCSGRMWALVGGTRVEYTKALAGPITSLVAISEDGFGVVHLVELNGRVWRVK